MGFMGKQPKAPAIAPAAAAAPVAAAVTPDTQVAKVTDTEITARKNKKAVTDFSTTDTPLGSNTLLGS